ncbi:helix-turn-helix domain-containing protein [Paenibacillus cellulositrophicus]|uniref:helix-turn-helix domain-containing protein n=1 Tax=Paenibacillus cellulositrophicus TaxID=562959 RepID=UPI003F7F8962
MVDPKAKEFGNYLRNLRKNKGLTLIQLKEATSLSQPYLSQIENGLKGIPSPETLRKLAAPLGVPYEELLHYAGYLEGVFVESSKSIYSSHYFSLKRAKQLLTKDGKLDPKYREEIDEVLKTDTSLSITTENLFEKLEKFVDTATDWTEVMNSGKDLFYFNIFNKLDELSRKVELASKDILTLIKDPQFSYNGHKLTVDDKKRVIEMFNVLFPEYKSVDQDKSERDS